MANIQVLDKDKHRQLKLNSERPFSDSMQSHVVQITVFELAKVAAEYPIAFIKDRDTGQFHLVALLGLQPNENLFIRNGQWLGSYLPLQYKVSPFVLSKHPNDENKHLLCLDLDSELISENSGDPLFDSDGNQSKLLADKTDYLGQLMEQTTATQKFIKVLIEKELLSPQSLSIKQQDGEEYSLTGLYAINETSLNELSTDSYQELRQLGVISPIYACLFSLNRVENLVRLKADR